MKPHSASQAYLDAMNCCCSTAALACGFNCTDAARAERSSSVPQVLKDEGAYQAHDLGFVLANVVRKQTSRKLMWTFSKKQSDGWRPAKRSMVPTRPSSGYAHVAVCMWTLGACANQACCRVAKSGKSGLASQVNSLQWFSMRDACRVTQRSGRA